MKAMLLTAPGAPLELHTVPDPQPGPGEAVARVLACGAGLTVHHVRSGRVRVDYPRILGHEITGEIVAVGPGITNLACGDGVTAYFYLTCGECRWCAADRETLCDNFRGYVGREVDGGYAEYIRLPARNFIRLPDALDWRGEPAGTAVICDAVATPVKVVRRARISSTDTVAVFGAGRGLGLHMLQAARWAGAHKVIAVDVARSKFDACLAAGADAAVDPSEGRLPERLLEMTAGRGIDVALDFVCSTSTLEAGVEALGKGGRLVVLGGNAARFTAGASAILGKELEVMGSRYATHDEVRESLELVARGELHPIVSEQVPLADAERIHQRLETGEVTGRAALII